jgi:erythronate-4-phosphate dehydrogenase
VIRIVADHKIPFLKGALEGVASIKYLPGNEISREDLMDADALITRTRTMCNRELLEGTGVRFIASATIGYDHIDPAYCETAGIGWTNAPGCNASSVRQYVVSALLSLANRDGMNLDGLTLGVVGVGNVGSQVAMAGRALGMKVLLNDPPRARIEGDKVFTPLENLLERADVVTLHVPLNKEGEDKTAGMVDDRFMEMLKRGAVLINSSRGGVVDEEALVRGISSGKTGDVVLDVYRGEPAINRVLMDVITLATPHIAGYSLDGKADGTGMAVRAVSKHFSLGMDDWQPAGIPLPEDPVLQADAASRSGIGWIWELYRKTYDITRDDAMLRKDPSAFERLRGEYPFRREPGAYTVRLLNEFPGRRKLLGSFGFTVIPEPLIKKE